MHKAFLCLFNAIRTHHWPLGLVLDKADDTEQTTSIGPPDSPTASGPTHCYLAMVLHAGLNMLIDKNLLTM